MKKKMRKMMSLILCMGMLCNLTACGLVGSKETEASTEATAEVTTGTTADITTFGMTIAEFYYALNQTITDAGYSFYYGYSADETDSDSTLALTVELSDGTIQLPVYLNGYQLTEDDDTMSIITLVLPYESWVSIYFDEEDDTGTLAQYEVSYFHVTLAAIRVLPGVADSIDLETAGDIIWDVVISSTPTYTEEDLCYAYYFDGDEAESSNVGIILAHTDTMEQIGLN